MWLSLGNNFLNLVVDIYLSLFGVFIEKKRLGLIG